MSFVAAATAIGLEGIAANIAAGAMMGGSVKVASNVVSGQDPFKDVGRSLITGGFTGGFAPGVAETFNIGMPAAAGLVAGGIETLATGSLSRGLMAGLGAYGTYGLAEGMGGGKVGGEQVFGDVQAAKGSIGDTFNKYLTSPDAGSTPFTAASNPSGNFFKDNWKYMAAAATPIMADMMVPTTTKQPDIRSTDTINRYIRNEDGTLTALNPVPAAGYGTPAWKPFNEGGIVALNNGGLPRYGAGDLIKEADLKNIYTNLGGDQTRGKEVFDKISSDYLKAGGTQAGLPSIFSKYTTAPAAVTPAAVAPIVAAPAGIAAAPAVAAATLTPQQQAAMALMFKSSTGGVDQAAMDALGGSAAVRKLAESAGYTGDVTQLYDYAAKTPGAIDWKSKAGEQLASNYITARDAKAFTDKFKTPADQALELLYRSSTVGAPTTAFDSLGGYSKAKQIAAAAGFEATPEWQQAYEKKMGYTVIPRMSTAETLAADKAASDRLKAADTTGTIGSRVTSNGIVDLKTDTSVKQDKTDTTTTGINTLATTKPGDIKSSVTTDGTYTGTTGTAPAVNTVFGQGKYTGTGSEMGTGTTGPIVDFGGVSPFGKTSPMSLAQTQIAEESAAKTAADKAKLDLYSQWGTSNPTATALDRANFMDKLGLPPETTAALRNISPDQAKSEYYTAKFDQQTGDSQAAYKYLMGQGAYPTKAGVGEIARPYAEATLGYPASTNKQYIYDATTGKYNRNPDYVAEYKDATGVVNYKMSPAEVFNYFKTNAGQGDDATYSWAIANNLTPQDIANATGVPLSQIAPKWRAAVAKNAATKAATNEDGTIDQEKLTAQERTDFDATAYLKANPDVQAELDAGTANFGDKSDIAAAAWNHYLNYGKAGGRAYTKKAAGGGMMGYAMGGMPMYSVGGGLGSLGSYSDGGRLLRGPGDGVSDSIPATIGRKQQPARLADGEFVVPARIVSELGNGSTEAGAKKLYAMMDRVQRARGKTTGKNKVAANSRADKYLPA